MPAHYRVSSQRVAGCSSCRRVALTDVLCGIVGVCWWADVTCLCVCPCWFPALVPAHLCLPTTASLCNTYALVLACVCLPTTVSLFHLEQEATGGTHTAEKHQPTNALLRRDAVVGRQKLAGKRAGNQQGPPTHASKTTALLACA